MLRRNVLIFHAGALGDFILTWPVAMALARVCAQSRIFYVTAGEKGRLAERVLGVESRDAEGGWQHLFGDAGKLPDTVRRGLEGAQLVVNFVAGETDAWTRNLRDASRGAEVLTVRPRPPQGEEHEHVSRFIMNQLAGHRVLHAAVGQMLASIAEKGAGTVRKGGGKVLLHPGSGSRTKCWPVERWVELAHLIGPEDVRILLGEAERERLSPGDLAVLETAGELRWPRNYGELLDELSAARAFVGNDSGPGHLAGVIGLPTLALFGPTDPAVWAPMGPRVAALRGGADMTAITVDAAWQKFRSLPPPPNDVRPPID